MSSVEKEKVTGKGKEGMEGQSSSSSSSSSSSKGAKGKSSRRQTVHTIVETKRGRWYIVSSLSTRRDTQVIGIDPMTGSLSHQGHAGVDVFACEQDALDYLTRGSSEREAFRSMVRSYALLGYVVLGQSAYIIIATKIRRSLVLFGAHQVFTILTTKWIPVKLAFNFPSLENQEAEKNLETLKEFPLDGLHYFCETLDITRPFPSVYPVEQCSEEFCWNSWLSEPFERLGMRRWCVVMCQGMAMGRTIQGLTLCLFARRSNKNPGTRYYARGLNEKGAPGNEVECEQLLWTGTKKVKWASSVWRRGTVPIWWRTEMKSSGTEADVIVRENPFENCELYYARLMERFPMMPVRCINLLQNESDQPETVLNEHFQQSLRFLKHAMSGLDVELISFNWVQNLQFLKLQETVGALWGLLEDTMINSDVSVGTIRLFSLQESSVNRCPSGHHAHFDFSKRQKSVLRYNCLDGLDRTNLVTFFISFQILWEQVRELGIPIDEEENENENENENEKDKAWKGLKLGLDELCEGLDPALLECLTEFYVCMGDICSELYTSSPAIHSDLMRQYSHHTSSASSGSGTTNVTLQRRYHNIVHDHIRQSQFEMLLGSAKHFPELGTQRTQWMSSYPSFSMKTLPCLKVVPLFETIDTCEYLLQDDGICWITPLGYNIVEFFIFLRRPCVITEVVVVSKNSPLGSYPAKMDIETGMYLDNMHIRYQYVDVPQCEEGTRMHYPFRSQDGEKSNVEEAYDFHGTDPAFDNLERIVKITFSDVPEQTCMTLGKVEVYGIPNTTEYSEMEDDNALLRHRTSRMVDDIVSKLSDNGDSDDSEQQQENVKEQAVVVESETGGQQGEETSSSSSSSSSSGSTSSSSSTPVRYEDLVRTRLASVGTLSLIDALELEYARLKLNLTPQQRNDKLHHLGQNFEDHNPNRFIYRRDVGKVKEVLKNIKYQSWGCQNPKCGTVNFMKMFSQCYYCHGRFCSGCMDSNPPTITEFMWEEQHPVCNTCSELLQKHDQFLQECVSMSSKQAFKVCVGPGKKQENLLTSVETMKTAIVSKSTGLGFQKEKRLNLCEYPYGGILFSVPCRDGGPPPEAILLDAELFPLDLFWSTEMGVSSVEIDVVLRAKAVLTGLMLIVDSMGYNAQDVPQIEITTSHTIQDMEECGTWNLENDLNENGVVDPYTRLEHRLQEPMPCRIVKLKLSIAESTASQCKIHLGRLKMFGKLVSPSPAEMLGFSQLTREQLRTFQSVRQATQPLYRDQITPMWAKTRNDGMAFDIRLSEEQYVSGFGLITRHSKEEGFRAQLKRMRVFVATVDSKDETQHQIAAGTYVVAKTEEGVQMFFDFEVGLMGNMIKFEFQSNYGGKELQVPELIAF